MPAGTRAPPEPAADHGGITGDADMNATLTPAPPTADRAQAVAPSWRAVQQGVMLGDLVLVAFMLVVTLALQGQFDPMPIVIGVVVAGAWLSLRRGRGRAGVIYGGVVSLLLVALVVAFGGLATFARPQSTFDLILMGGLLVTNLAGLVACVQALRAGDAGADGGRGAVVVPRVTGALIALLVVVGVVAGVTAYSASPRPGDLQVKAHQFEFTRTHLQARAGRVSVWIQNDDPAHHDFTIKGVVSTALPGEKARRAVFDVEPGTYRFYCTIHPDQMQGTLTVTR
jgi:plastocyanin